jgi:hypothetical protein
MPQRIRAQAALVIVLAFAFALAACSRPASTGGATTQGVRVTEVDLGRSLNADKTIGDKTDSFRPADTIYAAVVTEGSSSNAALKARWTYQDGQLVDESVRTIAPAGKATTEFHISKPDGLPTGKYKVEVSLDGTSAGTKNFEVK